jgi:hypothetical protein
MPSIPAILQSLTMTSARLRLVQAQCLEAARGEPAAMTKGLDRAIQRGA